MASIEKRGKGYRISVSCGRDIFGKQIVEKTTFVPDPRMTRKQQEKALEVFAIEFEQRVRTGKYYSGEKMLLKDFAEKWLEEYAREQLGAASHASYTLYLNGNILPALGHLLLGKITPMHLNDFYNSQLKDGARKDGRSGGYSPGSIRKMHVVLSSIFTTAVNWQLVESNPCTRVKPPKLDRLNSDIGYFTLEQAKDFLDALEMEYTSEYSRHIRKKGDIDIPVKDYSETRGIPTQFKVFFHIALFGGLRRGEVLGLSWRDVNFEENSVSVNKSVSYANNEVSIKHPKTKSSIRKVVLPEIVMALIRKYKKEYYEYRLSFGSMWPTDESGNATDWLFIQTGGKLMHPSTPYGTFKDIIRKYNAVAEEGKKLPEISLHAIRHTHSTLLISENVDIRTVSARLGHAKTSTTLDFYTHAIRARDAVVADKLDNLFSKTPKKEENHQTGETSKRVAFEK